ncbi:copper homeostasis protein CutC [Pedobacter miscanthi]|jgi:copper homeostasis protein|uniref:PF03932 family protein CutC n=1 Tax=Pedobacter miscanthi TaxID=2259170 RepID=A0A366KZR4_9SPHI|nr:copper homeostasis protein CutC [Pedobacter miscanthi]RBQ06733.1 copper homeostasis protein CutC [Pedobacter miscanthi]
MPVKQLEVCAFNIQSSIIAQRVGANRVELCDNPLEGGTTPSYGTIKQVREQISIDLYPILRPRSGNYFYSQEEYRIIKDDIQMCRDLGCNGISVGTQQRSGKIDKEWLKRIVEWAGPMGVTCNRAFDGTPDLFQALEDLIECGCERVLTSGGAAGAPEGAQVLRELTIQANNRIIIMPGAGIKSNNLKKLIDHCHATQYHASARAIVPNPLHYINSSITDYGNLYVSSETELSAMLNILHQVH